MRIDANGSKRAPTVRGAISHQIQADANRSQETPPQPLRTRLPFHGANTGSNPVGDANKTQGLRVSLISDAQPTRSRFAAFHHFRPVLFFVASESEPSASISSMPAAASSRWPGERCA